MESHFYSRIELLRDFMLNCSRPVDELNIFLRAYDDSIDLIILHSNHNVNELYVEPPVRKFYTQEDGALPLVDEVEPAPKHKVVRRVKYAQVIHSGTTPNIHPRAKMVMAEFPGREPEFYGSMKAAADHFCCSEHAISNAIVNKTELNGCMLKNNNDG